MVRCLLVDFFVSSTCPFLECAPCEILGTGQSSLHSPPLTPTHPHSPPLTPTRPVLFFVRLSRYAIFVCGMGGMVEFLTRFVATVVVVHALRGGPMVKGPIGSFLLRPHHASSG